MGLLPGLTDTRCNFSSDSNMDSSPKEIGWVPVAVVARPHGVRGELRLKVYNLESDLLTRRPLIRFVFDDQTIETRPLSVRRVPGALLFRLKEITDRNQAERMRSVEFSVKRSDLDELEAEEFYYSDLEGCDVVLEDEVVGRISHVQTYPTCDALVVLPRKGPKFEIPLHADFVAEIQVDQNRVVVTAIPGREP